MYLQDIAQTTFNSSGDIRLLPAQFISGATTELFGYLTTAGNLAFNAADVYPATDTGFVLEAASRTSTPSVISFGYPAGGGPSNTTPLSAGGELIVSAGQIIQNGELQAPFGQIILGNTPNSTAISNLLFGISSGAGDASVRTRAAAPR